MNPTFQQTNSVLKKSFLSLLIFIFILPLFSHAQTLQSGKIQGLSVHQLGTNNNYTVYETNSPVIAGTAYYRGYLVDNNGNVVANTTDSDANIQTWNSNIVSASDPVQAAKSGFSNGISNAVSVANQGAKLTPSNNGGQCWLGPSNGFLDVGNCLSQVGYFILFVLSRILALVGVLFGLIINTTVIGMSQLVSSQNLPALTAGWKTFRDLANIVFIFVLLYISIATILRLNGYDAKSLLVKLIIAALLINFSLFFTKVIIDASNILATTIYSKITLSNGQSLANGQNLGDAFMEPFGLQTIVPTDNGTPDNSTSFSQRFLQGLNPVQPFIDIYNYTSNNNGQSTAPQRFAASPNSLTLAIMGAIFILIGIFVFVAAIVLFLIRFCLLIILMVLSPLAFVGSILPTTSSYAKRFWRTLVSESFFAPVFILMVWFSLAVVNQLRNLTGVGKFSEAALHPDQGASVLIVLNFGVVIVLLIASLIIAKQMGAYGGDRALRVFNGLRKSTQGFLGRNTLGEIGRRVDRGLARTRFGNTAFGDALRGVTSQRLATAKFGSSTSREDAYKRGLELQTRTQNIKNANDVRQAVAQMAATRHLGEDHEDYVAAKQRAESAMIKINPSEINKVFKPTELKDRSIAALATHAQAKAVDEDKELSQEQKKEFFDNRNAEIDDYFRRVDDERAKFIKSGMTPEAAQAKIEELMNEKDPAKPNLRMPKRLKDRIKEMHMDEHKLNHKYNPELYTNREFVRTLRGSQYSDLIKSSDFTPTEKKRMKELRVAPISDAVKAVRDRVTGGGLPTKTELGKVREELEKVSPKEIPDLPDEVLYDPNFMQFMDRNLVSKLAEESNEDKIKVLKFISKKVSLAIHTGEPISEPTRSVWEWLLKDRNGKTFLSAGAAEGITIDDYDSNIDSVLVRNP